MLGREKNALLSNCTVVVSSCDKYEELWVPFFKLLRMAWNDIPCPIVLNTEEKQYVDEKLNVICINQEGTLKWGGRLKEVLKRINTDYVLFMLDDFFVDGIINSEKIADCIEWMNGDKSISVFSFMETFADKYDDKKHPGFERRRVFGEYRFNCQAAVWRRKHLIQYLRKNESPWEWEVFGNWRSYRYFWRKFYSRNAQTEQIIPYIFNAGGQAHGGLVLVGGKWYLPVVNHFQKKYGIEFDLTTREGMTEEDFERRSGKRNRDLEMPRKKMILLRKLYQYFLMIKRVLINVKYIF